MSVPVESAPSKRVVIAASEDDDGPASKASSGDRASEFGQQ